MQPQTASITGVGTSNVLVVSPYISPFNVGLGVKVTGTITYSIQHTFDNPLAPGFSAATATWYNHAYMVSQTANMDGNYAYPVQAVRVNTSAGTGTAQLTLIQAGMPGK
jgi:hypothetical protein